jgi:hypothetical protein
MEALRIAGGIVTRFYLQVNLVKKEVSKVESDAKSENDIALTHYSHACWPGSMSLREGHEK